MTKRTHTSPDAKTGDRTQSAEAVARLAITGVLAAIAALTFAFSFGNTWTVGLRLGVDPWIAPLVGPAVDLSVVGLLTGIQYAISRGVGLDRLRRARALLAFCGAATVALNIAEPIARGDYGKASFEIVGPILLLGWSEVGPALLREIYTATHPTRRSEANSATALAPSEPSRIRPNVSKTSETRSADHELVDAARLIDQQHRNRYGRPISADNLRRELAISAARARMLVQIVRSGPGSIVHKPERTAGCHASVG